MQFPHSLSMNRLVKTKQGPINSNRFVRFAHPTFAHSTPLPRRKPTCTAQRLGNFVRSGLLIPR